MQRKCKQCDKIFNAKRKDKFFCSKKCKDRFKRGLPEKLICKSCRIEYKPKSKHTLENCPKCNRIIKRKPHEDKRRARNYANDNIPIRRTINIISQKYIVKIVKDEIGCMICGNKSLPHVALDFHHVNNEDKELALSELINRSQDMLLDEIQKCVIYCCICHKIHHYGTSNLSYNGFDLEV